MTATRDHGAQGYEPAHGCGPRRPTERKRRLQRASCGGVWPWGRVGDKGVASASAQEG